MTIYRKILLLGALISLVYIGLTGLVLVGVIRRGFETLEVSLSRQDLARCQTFLKSDLDQLGKAGRDYAYGDEVYRFLADRDETLVASNFAGGVYDNLHLDLIRILDNEGRIVYENIRSAGPFAQTALPDFAATREHLRGDAEGLGIWRTDAGLAMLAVFPVRDNSRQLPPRGYLFFARLLTPDYVRSLAEKTRLNFSLEPLADGMLERAPLDALDPNENFLRIPREAGLQDIYSLLEDGNGKPVGVIKLVLPREVTIIGERSTVYGMQALMAGLGISLGAFVWFTRRYVTRNIQTMTRAVVSLSDDEQAGSLVPVLGRDEIGTLAEKFNLLLEQNRAMKSGLEQLVAARTGELQQANEALLLSSEVFDHVLEAIIITDREGILLRANPAFETVTGFTVAEALGRKANLVKSDRHPPEFYAEMWRQLTTVGAWQGEIWNRRKSGEIFPAMLSITSLRRSGGEISHYIGTMEDISLNKRNEERIRYLAFHDPLTGLSNRVLFADRTATNIQRVKRDRRQLALFVLDLDGFKQVNDQFGHAAGDLLLVEIAGRLKSVLRAEDTVARFGGDEFTALVPELDDVEDALVVAQKILATIEQPMVLRGQSVRVSASIGISVFPKHGEDYQSLFNAADSAMYQVKSSGKAGFRLSGSTC